MSNIIQYKTCDTVTLEAQKVLYYSVIILNSLILL